MWYKNLRVYKFTEQADITMETLLDALITRPFVSCGSHDEFSFGFTDPVKSDGLSLAHKQGDYLAFCGKKEEKVLPAGAINEELTKRIAVLEAAEGRKLPSKERSRMKDELIFEMLPRAFTQPSKTHAYIDTKNGYLIVDAASTTKAEDLLSQLRKVLGSLPVIPLQPGMKSASIMTTWMLDSDNFMPSMFTLDDECELHSPEKGGGIIRCKRHDLHLPEIINHIDQGKQVRKLALTYNDRISFTLDTDLAIKRLKFLDLVQEQAAEIEAFDEVEQFEADFAIMTAEIAALIHYIENAFSGEVMQ